MTDNISTFITKDSGKRAQFANGGVRDTEEGKPRFDLLLPLNVPYLNQLLTRAALLMGRGAEKYNDRNWEQFGDEAALQRAKSSAIRHLMQLVNGEEDEDHGAAVVFNVMVFEYVKGVLSGKWQPLTGKVSEALRQFDEVMNRPLWTGTYRSQEPPAHVVQLRRTDRTWKPVGEEEFLWRRGNGGWSWATRGEFTEDEWAEFIKNPNHEGFTWTPSRISPTYRLEEVSEL